MNNIRTLIKAFILLIAISGPGTSLIGQTNPDASNKPVMTDQAIAKDFYSFKVTALDGSEFDFASLKGTRVLIVNTASKCGFTPQYEGLQNLFEQYGGKEFTIIGFPANNFAGQEPGSDEEIATFCKVNYGVSFPMMSKISVKGDDEHPIFAWLTQRDLNGVSDAKVKWNFNKFLIDETGQWVAWYPSSVKPDDERIEAFASGQSW